MLYITLNTKNLKRIGQGIVIFALLTMLVCIWAICARENMNQEDGGDAVSSAQITELPPEFNVITPSDAENEGIPSRGSGDEPAVPAHVSLMPFSLNQPVALPVESAFISSAFGFRDHPINGVYKFHSGLDLAAPEGTPIYAMLDGKVTTAKFASDYGNYVIIDHGGFQTLYAHCLSLDVSAGDEVEKGQRIALVGATGSATGNHLHVEFRCNGQRYDPAVVLGDSYS